MYLVAITYSWRTSCGPVLPARAKKRLARVHTVVCPICGKAFETDRVQARYCSKECAKAAHNAQLRSYAQKRQAKDAIPANLRESEGKDGD